MSPEVPETGLPELEQSEQTSSSRAHPPSHRSKTSSTGQQVPEDTATSPNEIQNTTPVDTANAAPADLLTGAIEDGPNDDYFMVKARVCITPCVVLCSLTYS